MILALDSSVNQFPSKNLTFSQVPWLVGDGGYFGTHGFLTKLNVTIIPDTIDKEHMLVTSRCIIVK